MSHWKELRNLLRESRLRAGLTQAALSQKLGYRSPQFVSNWERGLALPPPHKARKLIALLQLDPHRYIKFVMKGSQRSLEHRLKKLYHQTGNQG